MHPMQTIAVRAARAAGQFIIRAYGQSDKITVSSIVTAKGEGITTNINSDAFDTIKYQILKSYPEHIVVTDTDTINLENSKFVWIVNPLEGIDNFVRGIPHFAISIALQVNGVTEVAVIYDPIQNELFTASKGNGAQYNDYKMRVKAAQGLHGTLIGINFPTTNNKIERYMLVLQNILAECKSVQSTGCVALALAYVASGRIDGMFYSNLDSSSLIAGDLICREAGGIVTDFTGGHNYLKQGNIVAGSSKVTVNLVKILMEQL